MVRKILCTEVLGLPVGTAMDGFDVPNSEDEANVLATLKALNSGELLNGKIVVNTKFDLRFIIEDDIRCWVLAIWLDLFSNFNGTRGP